MQSDFDFCAESCIHGFDCGENSYNDMFQNEYEDVHDQVHVHSDSDENFLIALSNTSVDMKMEELSCVKSSKINTPFHIKSFIFGKDSEEDAEEEMCETNSYQCNVPSISTVDNMLIEDSDNLVKCFNTPVVDNMIIEDSDDFVEGINTFQPVFSYETAVDNNVVNDFDIGDFVGEFNKNQFEAPSVWSEANNQIENNSLKNNLTVLDTVVNQEIAPIRKYYIFSQNLCIEPNSSNNATHEFYKMITSVSIDYVPGTSLTPVLSVLDVQINKE